MADPMAKYLPASVRKLQRKKKREPRVKLAELNQGGLEAFRTRKAEVEEPEDKRPGYVKALDILDVPGNAIRNIIGDIAGVDKSKLEKATFGRHRVTTADILEKAGMRPGFLRSAIGLVGDIVTDPLLYLGAPIKSATALIKGAPRVLPKGMSAIRTAAKTGKFTPELESALNAARAGRTARVSKALSLAKSPEVQAARRAGTVTFKSTGKEVARAARSLPSTKVYSSARGPIARGLAVGFKQGAEPTLQFLKKFGEKGPSLFGVPFTKMAAGTLSPQRVEKLLGQGVAGKLWKPNEAVSRLLPKTSKMASVEHGLANPQSWEAIQKALAATKAGRAALVSGMAGASAAKERGAAQAREAEKAVMAATAKTGIGEMPKPFASMVKGQKVKIAKAQKAAAGEAFVPIRTARQKAAQEIKAGRAAQREGENLLHAATSSPAAPGPVQQIQAIEQGHRAIPGKGILQTLQRAKRDLFGGGRSEARTLTAGLEARHARGLAKEAVTMHLASKRIAPIIKRYAIGGETPESVRDTLHAIASAGPDGRYLSSFPSDSVLHGMYAKAQQMGMATDPEVRAVVGDLWRGGEANLALAKSLGLPVKKLETYAQPRVPTREAIEHWKRQHQVTGNVPIGPKPGGKISTGVPQSLPRGRWNYYQMPDGTLKKAYSENQLARDLEKAGGKLAKTEDISVQDWNKMASDQNNPLGIKAWGQAREGEAAPKAKMFETDIVRSFGAQARQQEHMRFVADTQSMINRYAVKVSNAQQASRPEFAHLVKIGPGEIDPNGAFGELAKRGVFDVYLPPEIADLVRRIVHIDRSPQAVGEIVRATDRTLGFWKTMQLFHPSYLLRNVWTNGLVHKFNGGRVLRQSAVATDRNWIALRNAAVAGSEQGIAGKTLSLGGQIVPQRSVYKFVLDHNGVGAGRSSMHGTTLTGEATRAAAFKAAAGKTKGATQSIFRANMFAEDMQRLGAWADFVDQGLDWESAWRKSMLSMPDLSDLTPFERSKLQRLIPFYSWMRTNAANQMLHYLPQKPYIMASLPKFRDFAEGLRGEANVPRDLQPEWMREGLAAQVAGNAERGTAFVPMSWTPHEETLAALAGPLEPKVAIKQMAESVRPEIKFAIEAATGKNIFRGTDYPPNLTGAKMIQAIPKALIGESNTPMDTLIGMRPIREPFRMAQMQTPVAAGARVLIGGGLQPVSRRGGLSAEYTVLSDRAKSIRQQIGRAKQANDTALVKSLLLEWTRTMKRMQELGLPGVPKATQGVLAGQGVQAGPPAFE